MHDVHSQVETVARNSYGRLTAWLAYQWRDLAAAEDALAEALVKALSLWPTHGIPRSPDAWLLTVAKRQLIQKNRHDKLRLTPEFNAVFSEASEEDVSEQLVTRIPDRRLMLMLVCAHPAIDESMHMPLMLQVVLGLEVADIAPAMLVSPSALAQRLVRSKQKIRAAGIAFEEAEPKDLPMRIHSVLEAIYGAFGLSRDLIEGAEPRIVGLDHEAIYLCNIVCELLPDSAEAKGLLSLMLFSLARRPAQLSASGEFIPLGQQDPQRWNMFMIHQAETLLRSAHALNQPGQFQWEAAIQSAHCQRLFSGTTPWHAIAQLYQQLNATNPTLGASVAGAVAQAEAGEPEYALQLLDDLKAQSVQNFQPWWVARAHVLQILDRNTEAAAALQQALGLSTQPVIKHYLKNILGKLNNG